jgi:hypothetical protein
MATVRLRPFARASFSPVSTASAPESEKCTRVSPAGATDTRASAARATVGSSRMRVATGWVRSWRSTASMTIGCRLPMMKTP